MVCTYWFAFAVGVTQFIALKLQSGRDFALFRSHDVPPLHPHQTAVPIRRAIVHRHASFRRAAPALLADSRSTARGADSCFRSWREPVISSGHARIIIDSAVALFLWLLSAVDFRNRKATWGFVAGSSAIAAGGLLAVIINPRLNDLATRGVLAGDSSMSARTLPYACTDVVVEARPESFSSSAGVRAIYPKLCAMATQAHGNGSMPTAAWRIRRSDSPTPTDTFDDAYSSFITEFGIVMFALLVVLLVHVIKHHAWNRTTVCWLVLTAYLFISSSIHTPSTPCGCSFSPSVVAVSASFNHMKTNQLLVSGRRACARR